MTDKLQIPDSCNCEYRNDIFIDLQKVLEKHLKKHEILGNEFAYMLIQLATYYLKQADASEDQIMEFALKAVQSVQKREDYVE